MTIPGSHFKSGVDAGDRVIQINANYEDVTAGKPRDQIDTEDLVKYIKKNWRKSSSRHPLRPEEMKRRGELLASKTRKVVVRDFLPSKFVPVD